MTAAQQTTPAATADRPDWRHHTACQNADPELFFPVGTGGLAILQIKQAKQVCQRCSVSAPCLAWALRNAQDFGVWGGMTEDERRALRQRDIVAATDHSTGSDGKPMTNRNDRA